MRRGWNGAKGTWPSGDGDTRVAACGGLACAGVVSGTAVMRCGIVFCLALLLGILCMGNAQAAPVCSNTPSAGQNVVCLTTDTSSTADIDIDLDGVAISTTNASDRGVRAEHAGGTTATPADIMIDVTGTATKNTISTEGSQAEGILGKHTGTGDVDIDVTGVGISTGGWQARGVYGEHTGTGDIAIDIRGRTTGTTGRTISTNGIEADGVYGKHTGTGDVDIDVRNIAIEIAGGTGNKALGVYVEHSGDGDVDVAATGVSITTGSVSKLSRGVYATHTGTGNISLAITGSSSTITTTTDASAGVTASVSPEMSKTGGNIAVKLGNTRINTSGALASGVDVSHGSRSSGTLTTILNSGVAITTQGDGSYGVISGAYELRQDRHGQRQTPLPHEVLKSGQQATGVMASGVAGKLVVAMSRLMLTAARSPLKATVHTASTGITLATAVTAPSPSMPRTAASRRAAPPRRAASPRRRVTRPSASMRIINTRWPLTGTDPAISGSRPGTSESRRPVQRFTHLYQAPTPTAFMPCTGTPATSSSTCSRAPP